MCVCTHVYVLTAPAIFLVFAFVAAFEFLNFQKFPWFLRFLRFLNFWIFRFFLGFCVFCGFWIFWIFRFFLGFCVFFLNRNQLGCAAPCSESKILVRRLGGGPCRWEIQPWHTTPNFLGKRSIRPWICAKRLTFVRSWKAQVEFLDFQKFLGFCVF